MFVLEVKIIVLTIVYFVGWFTLEKAFYLVWDKWNKPARFEKKKPKFNMSSLATVTPLDQTERYIKGLNSPDWRVRRISCIQLGEKRGSAVVDALVKTLKDAREEVSIAAGEALAKIGDPSAISQLTEHVQELDRKVERSREHYRAA